ncbi:hypothetical protein B0A55_00288 [Friedmanniomyces simplex]|uniref:F-box domain-containing protein n=1 Tax=Friedmanniomyces simplex TaxID=329884 RepID=A0A4U0Y7P1_9PEZI|nr:hypothetical protein B0A55_00288 [Friedmanniomyces simplex]
MFLDLPPELRLRIYEHALHFGCTLQKPLRAAAWRRSDGCTANVSLLRASKLIYREAIDILYDVNSFAISYNHVCYCENTFPYPALEPRMRTIRITNFLPRIDQPQTCNFCQSSGFGLLEHLMQMPKLNSAVIAFENVFSFADFVPELLRNLAAERTVELSSGEVGEVNVLGPESRLCFELPALQRAWSALARGERAKDARNRVPGELTMRRALEYLQFETNTYDRTAETLLPFFTAYDDEDSRRRLRFVGLPDEHKKRAGFTVALAGVMNDIFADDGGSESITWVEIGGMMHHDRWAFCEDAEQTADRARGRVIGAAI